MIWNTWADIYYCIKKTIKHFWPKRPDCSDHRGQLSFFKHELWILKCTWRIILPELWSVWLVSVPAVYILPKIKKCKVKKINMRFDQRQTHWHLKREVWHNQIAAWLALTDLLWGKQPHNVYTSSASLKVINTATDMTMWSYYTVQTLKDPLTHLGGPEVPLVACGWITIGTFSPGGVKKKQMSLMTPTVSKVSFISQQNRAVGFKWMQLNVYGSPWALALALAFFTAENNWFINKENNFGCSRSLHNSMHCWFHKVRYCSRTFYLDLQSYFSYLSPVSCVYTVYEPLSISINKLIHKKNSPATILIIN